MPTDSLNATGASQTWDVPPGLTSVFLELYGSGSNTRNGGFVSGDLTVTGGETLTVYVGEEGTRSTGSDQTGGGFPGGADGRRATHTPPSGHYTAVAESWGGAGYTAVRQGGDTQGDTVAVAGGAGGDGDADQDEGAGSLDGGANGGAGGEGGADTGESGADANRQEATSTGGSGGDQSAGGAAGSGSLGAGATGTTTSGSTGGDLAGGEGSVATDDVGLSGDDGVGAAAAGGGGAGWHGGGGGGAAVGWDGTRIDAVASGAGAGSNYDDGLTGTVTNTRGAGNAADGQVDVTYDSNAPENLTATLDGLGADLSWDAPSSGDVETPTRYDVYRSTEPGVDTGDPLAGSTPDGTTTTFDDTGLDEGTQYHYAVVAVYPNGGAGTPSNEDTVTTAIPTPTDLDLSLNATNPESAVDLTWTPQSTDETGFEIQYNRTGTWTGSESAGAGASSYTYTGLLNGEQYRFRIRAVGVDANSEWTSGESGTSGYGSEYGTTYGST